MQKRHKRTVAIVKKNIITGLESAKDSYDETEVFDDDEILVSHRVSSFKSLTSFFFYRNSSHSILREQIW